MRLLLASAVVLSLLPAAAGAEPATYPVQGLSFDMWCLETRHYPEERCDARQAADLEAFEDYREKVERYELPYLKRMEQEHDLQTRVLDHDSSERTNGRP